MVSKLLGLEKFTGWHMLGVLILFFGTIITVNFTLAFYANSTWSGLVVKNGYVASQEFDEVTAEKRRQLALGWTADTDYSDGVFSVTMTDAEKRPLRNAVVTARIGHPVEANEDRTVTLIEQGDGRYSADTELNPGPWAAFLNVVDTQGQVWTREIRFLVRG